jgi:hypothetical protein
VADSTAVVTHHVPQVGAVRRAAPLSRLLFYVYAIHAGLGIETLGINFAGNFGVGDLALVLAVGLLTVSDRPLRVPRMVFFPAALGVISTISWALAPLHGLDNFFPDAWGFVLRWFSYAVLLLVLPMVVVDRAVLWKILAAFAFGVVAQVVLAWITWWPEPRFQAFAIPLLGSEVYNANSVGFYLAMGVPVVIGLAGRTHSVLLRMAITLVLIGCIVSAVCTSSKATWFTIALLLFLTVALYSVRYPARGLIVLLIVLGTGWAVAQVDVSSFAVKTVQQRWAASQGSNLQRVEMIAAAAEMATDYPVFGAGPKAYQTVGIQYGRRERDPHNAYIWLAAEIGIFGSLVFIAAFGFAYLFSLVKLYRRGRSHTAELVALGGPFVAVLLQSFVTGLPASDKASWLLLGLVSLAGSLPYRQSQS